jgi:hypothetical protein
MEGKVPRARPSGLLVLLRLLRERRRHRERNLEEPVLGDLLSGASRRGPPHPGRGSRPPAPRARRAPAGRREPGVWEEAPRSAGSVPQHGEIRARGGASHIRRRSDLVANLNLGRSRAAIVGIARTERPLTVTQAAVVLVLIAEFAIFVSPRWTGNVFVNWATAQAVYVAAFASVSLLQAGFLAHLWMRRRRGLPILPPSSSS